MDKKHYKDLNGDKPYCGADSDNMTLVPVETTCEQCLMRLQRFGLPMAKPDPNPGEVTK